ncbi:hypothetical protein HDU99_001217 [Rhizoclosmatium hyalinum]|nr:hypothetical protein HDU99_001217 [Rhizoclosmatium hyalinum]
MSDLADKTGQHYSIPLPTPLKQKLLDYLNRQTQTSGVNIASSTPVGTATLHTNLCMKAYYARILFLESQACLIDERIQNISSDTGNQEEQSLMLAHREEIDFEDNATLCLQPKLLPWKDKNLK